VVIVYEDRPLSARGPGKLLQRLVVDHGAVKAIRHPNAAELWRFRCSVPRISSAHLRRFRQRSTELVMMLVLFARHEDA
jgi:hypothetical protein